MSTCRQAGVFSQLDGRKENRLCCSFVWSWRCGAAQQSGGKAPLSASLRSLNFITNLKCLRQCQGIDTALRFLCKRRFLSSSALCGTTDLIQKGEGRFNSTASSALWLPTSREGQVHSQVKDRAQSQFLWESAITKN